MVKWFKSKKVAPIHVMPGDTVTAIYEDKEGGRREQVTHVIDKSATYDTLAVGEIENELGFAEGLVGVIGKAQD